MGPPPRTRSTGPARRMGAAAAHGPLRRTPPPRSGRPCGWAACPERGRALSRAAGGLARLPPRPARPRDRSRSSGAALARRPLRSSRAGLSARSPPRNRSAAPPAPVAIFSGYLGDAALATTAHTRRGWELAVRSQRHYSDSFAAPRLLPVGRLPPSALAVTMDYRSEVLVVWVSRRRDLRTRAADRARRGTGAEARRRRRRPRTAGAAQRRRPRDRRVAQQAARGRHDEHRREHLAARLSLRRAHRRRKVPRSARARPRTRVAAPDAHVERGRDDGVDRACARAATSCVPRRSRCAAGSGRR